MSVVNIILGQQLLPGLEDIAELLTGKAIKTQVVSPERSLNLTDRVGLLSDDDLKSLGAGRIVRKTSERQSRWVIGTAVKTWQAFSSAKDLSQVGLFLGVGIVDCEDDDTPYSTAETLSGYTADALSETKPLAGLTVLNSTAASHIANILGITGVNSVFSPYADAGAQAIIEAFYNIQEGKCEHALVAGGSQKVTPWYFLSYRHFFKKFTQYAPCATESASAVIVSNESAGAGVTLLGVQRAFVNNDVDAYPGLDTLLSAMGDEKITSPAQVIYCGRYGLTEPMQQQLQRYFPTAALCNLEQLIGYTGPAAALHAVQLASAMLAQNKGIETSTAIDIKAITATTVLIICHGDQGQICYLLVGEKSHD